MHLGIDLGTTNSAAAVFDGERITLVRNRQGGPLTPSVVRIDGRGHVTVGARARRLLDSDPDNTRTEFKRLMGTEHRLLFPASRKELRPEELSAEVLRSIREDVKDQLGFLPVRAVVAVPALFELPQVSATAEAARLAGFERVEVLQEPVASAVAAGWSSEDPGHPWLVYDLGGGTFDVSLLETQDGLLRVVGHDGDNFLGGRDFDSAVIDYAIHRFNEQNGLTGARAVDRADPARISAIRRLRQAAEDAKIELARAELAAITVPGLFDGEDLDVELDRGTLEQLVTPLVERSIQVCLRLLATHGLRPDQLGRIVLVGGPTAMPLLRLRVREALGAAFAEGLDPMTLVAQGAALHAASVKLDARPSAPTVEARAGARVWLQYPAIASDPAPYVVGKRVDGTAAAERGSPAFTHVSVSREGGGWSSAREELDAEGAFALPVALELRKSNVFAIEGWRDGQRVPLSPSSFTIVHGVTVGDPPLSRTIGVALADDTVHVYFERGSPLPMRRTFAHQTVETIARQGGSGSPTSPDARNSPGYALKVPIVQGEFRLAHLCRLVGTLAIPASAVRDTLPVGSDVELTLELDRGGRLSAKAYIPALDQVFDQVAHLVTPNLGASALADGLAAQRRRVATLRARALREGDASAMVRLAELDQALSAVEADLGRAKGGDPDAAEVCRRRLLEADATLDEEEASGAWPRMIRKAREDVAHYMGLIGNFGTPVEQRIANEAAVRVEQAIQARKAQELERQLPALRSLAGGAWLRQPGAWKREFEAVAGRAVECTDAVRARQLVKDGRAALASGDDAGLQAATRGLWDLLPAKAEERRLGHDSGVR